MDDFLARSQAPTSSQVVNITGSGNTVAAALGDNNEVTVSIEEFDQRQAIQFADAVRQALPTLDLDEGRVTTLLRWIGRKPKTAVWPQRSTAALQTMLVNVSTSALSQLLAALGAAVRWVSPPEQHAPGLRVQRGHESRAARSRARRHASGVR